MAGQQFNSQQMMSTAEGGTSPPPEEREPCPTPLEWQDILQKFVAGADRWYCDWRGRRVFGRTWGEGRPLYFLNGLSGSHELFALTVWLLREKYRCVLFDYPATRTIDVESLADLVGTIVERQEPAGARVSLFAAGFGSLVAWQFASQSRERMDRIASLGGLTRLVLSPAEKLLTALGRVWPGRMRFVPARWSIMQRSHRPWFPPYDHSRWQFFFHNTGLNFTREVAGRFRAAAHFDAGPVLPDVEAPVLLIRSEGEGPVQQTAHDILTANLRDARSEFLHTSGQLSFLTHPHRLAKLLDGFLSESAGVEKNQKNH